MYGANVDQNRYYHTLPESEKYDEFNAYKLPHRFVRSEFFLEGSVEGCQRSKSEGDTDVHQNSEVQPTWVSTDTGLVVQTHTVQQDGNQSSQRSEEAVLFNVKK